MDSKSSVLKRYSDKIQDAMVECYRGAIESDGCIQYKIYVWDDGEIECLIQPQGDNSYLKPNDFETRSLYFVATIDAPFFNAWDYSHESIPDDEEEAEAERIAIIDWLVGEYRLNASDVLDAIISEAEIE